MSELIVIGYGDHATADAAQATVLNLQKDLIINLAGLAVVQVDEDGKQHVHTPGNLVGAGAASGATWGLIIGLFFLSPGLGAIVGGAWGALLGKLGRSGVDAGFRERVDGLLTPGKAALVLMVTKITEDKFNAAMAPHGGSVLKSSLSAEDEKELADMLGAAN